jgi:hypothetical protein
MKTALIRLALVAVLGLASEAGAQEIKDTHFLVKPLYLWVLLCN